MKKVFYRMTQILCFYVSKNCIKINSKKLSILQFLSILQLFGFINHIPALLLKK